jgi:3-oxoacyl-[acyl-carrier-protein] synthase-3
VVNNPKQQTKPCGVKIVGVGSSVPPTVLNNNDMAKMVETTDEWIQTRTGIRTRHVLSGDEMLTDLGVEASKQALAMAGVDGAEIDLIIVATTTPDERYPAMASRIQTAIGASKSFGFDLALACTGFVAALITAEQFLRSGSAKKALVIGADAHSRVMDWSDRNTCVLFGDAAGAVVIEASETFDGFLANDGNLDGSKADELHADYDLVNCPILPQPTPRNPYVQMNGREVFKFAVGVVPSSIRQTLENAGETLEDIDALVLHQANIRIMDAMNERLGIPREKMVINLDKYGNTSAASVPLALDEAVRNGQIQNGNRVMTCGFGGGLAWASSYFIWSGPSFEKIAHTQPPQEGGRAS